MKDYELIKLCIEMFEPDEAAKRIATFIDDKINLILSQKKTDSVLSDSQKRVEKMSADRNRYNSTLNSTPWNPQ